MVGHPEERLGQAVVVGAQGLPQTDVVRVALKCSPAEPDDLFLLLFGLRVLCPRGQQDGQALVVFHHIRLESDGLPELDNGLLLPARHPQEGAEVIVRPGALRPGGHAGREIGDRFLRVGRLQTVQGSAQLFVDPEVVQVPLPYLLQDGHRLPCGGRPLGEPAQEHRRGDGQVVARHGGSQLLQGLGVLRLQGVAQPVAPGVRVRRPGRGHQPAPAREP
jgi:hypothetical protein